MFGESVCGVSKRVKCLRTLRVVRGKELDVWEH